MGPPAVRRGEERSWRLSPTQGPRSRGEHCGETRSTPGAQLPRGAGGRRALTPRGPCQPRPVAPDLTLHNKPPSRVQSSPELHDHSSGLLDPRQPREPRKLWPLARKRGRPGTVEVQLASEAGTSAGEASSPQPAGLLTQACTCTWGTNKTLLPPSNAQRPQSRKTAGKRPNTPSQDDSSEAGFNIKVTPRDCSLLTRATRGGGGEGGSEPQGHQPRPSRRD